MVSKLTTNHVFDINDRFVLFWYTFYDSTRDAWLQLMQTWIENYDRASGLHVLIIPSLIQATQI
jgi:hypothetical protein